MSLLESILFPIFSGIPPSLPFSPTLKLFWTTLLPFCLSLSICQFHSRILYICISVSLCVSLPLFFYLSPFLFLFLSLIHSFSFSHQFKPSPLFSPSPFLLLLSLSLSLTFHSLFLTLYLTLSSFYYHSLLSVGELKQQAVSLL